ncbi:MAG: ABC transporter ATP-binding protein [Clostridiales bacterium]|nr:ABC transporter ATP-binding protein [Clostridiales bacterium]
MKTIKIMARSIREYKTATIITPLAVALEVVVECIIPLVMARFIDELTNVVNASITDFIVDGVILLLLAVAGFVFGTISGRYCAVASAGFAKNLRSDMFLRVQTFSFANIDKFSTSSLVTRLTTDVTNVQMAFMMVIRVAVRAPFMAIFSLVMAFTINVRMSIVFVVIMPILAFILIMGIRVVHPLFEKVFKKYDALNESVEENIKGIRVVKSYVREDYEIKKFNTTAEEVKKDFVKAEKLIALASPAMQLAMYSGIVIVSILSSMLIVKTFQGVAEDGSFIWGELSVGGLSSLITYGMQSLMSMLMVAMTLIFVTIANASSQRIAEVLEEESTLHNPENPLMNVEDGSIEFKNVSFKYSMDAERNALSNVNLKINSGETIGIIGGTGSSKSTLVQLIPRIYDATDGEVLVGGHNVKEYDLETLRNQVAMVLQKNVLFSGTVRENLKWGDENATDEEIIKYAKLAQAHEFIIAHQDGYDRFIEQGGANVSGGQKQRLCIARALLKKPKILILDDSTSAVDMKTDALIRKAFKEEIPNTTKIIIAQRIASIQDADKIIVIDNGEIVDFGTHDELLKRNNIYQEVYYSQNNVKGGAQNA